MKQAFTFRIWTADQTARLQAMWWEGLHPDDIAALLMAFTSAQIRDKAKREGFQRNPALHAGKKKTKTPEPPPALRDGNVICMANVKDRECRWIFGHPTHLSQMCGNITAGPQISWCDHHAGRLLA